MLARESIKVASTLLVAQTFSGLKNYNVASFRMMQRATVSVSRISFPLSLVVAESMADL
jgi:hypothetical protein